MKFGISVHCTQHLDWHVLCHVR